VRLEYLPAGSLDCPLILLAEFKPSEALQLRDAVVNLANARIEQLAVHELPDVVPVSGCELMFRVRAWDQAVVQVGPTSFECGFTAGTWDNVAGLVDPFVREVAGHQWLANSPGEVALLLSASGKW
jgi:hypothetical protein